jgi:hypothetical protein
VSDRIGEFGDASIVLITFARQRNLQGFRHRLGILYPVLADETRAAYRAYGLGRGPWWRIWGFRTLRTYGRLLRSGARLSRPTEDTLQLGGDFVVNSHGVLAYTYRSRSPDDRPSIDDLIAAVRSAP